MIVFPKKHITTMRVDDMDHHIIECYSGIDDTLTIMHATGGDAKAGFRIEDENGEASPNVWIRKDALAEVIQLLQSMHKEET